jgi:hypothetical protein
MYRSIAYCLFVVSALGATSFRHVSSLSYDVIPREVSARRRDVNSRLNAERNLYETRSDNGDDINDGYLLSQESFTDVDRTGDQLNDEQTLMSDSSFKRGAAGNKAKFLFGRSWPGPERPRGVASTGGSALRGVHDGYDSKRQETRRHFKFGKKSSDVPIPDNDHGLSSVKKRKMIKFGKKSANSGVDYLTSA